MRRKKKGEKLPIIRRISLTIKKVEELQTFGIVLKTTITGMACLIGFFVINFQGSMFEEFLNEVKEKIFILPTEVVEKKKVNWKKALVAAIIFYEKSAEKGNKRAQIKIKKAFKAT